jgi:hypothetical protein
MAVEVSDLDKSNMAGGLAKLSMRRAITVTIATLMKVLLRLLVREV